MIPNGHYTAVVDRIEDDHAAVILEKDGTDADEILVAPEVLPDAARHSDAVLSVHIDDGELTEATYDSAATEARKEAAQRRFDRLSKRPPSDDDQ